MRLANGYLLGFLTMTEKPNKDLEIEVYDWKSCESLMRAKVSVLRLRQSCTIDAFDLSTYWEFDD